MKLLRFSLYVVASLAIIVGTALTIYFTHASNGYLYFTKSSFLAHFGENANIEDFGLKCSESLDDINFELGEGVVRNGDSFIFNKTGNTYIKATCGDLKASINVQVVFDDFEEYFGICCQYSDGNLFGTTEVVNVGEKVKLYLPSCDEKQAKEDGYDNDCNVLVDFRKGEYDFSLITYQDIVKCDGNTITANSVGSTKIFVSFDNIGICANFDVEVLPISVQDIEVKNDTLYVQKGENFVIDYSVSPIYATDKSVDIGVNNSNVEYASGRFFARDYGESIVTIKSGEVEKYISVVVTDLADEIKVKTYGDVKFGETVSLAISTYKNGSLVDAQVECVAIINGVEVSLDNVAENIIDKHNTISLSIKTEEQFLIVVRIKNNPVISQTIYGNN